MKLELIRLIANIHYGNKENENRQILNEAISKINLSKDEKIFIDVFTKKLEKIVMYYSFASDLMKIQEKKFLALAYVINPGTIELSGFSEKVDKDISDNWRYYLTEDVGEKHGHIQNWMNEIDIKHEIFGDNFKSSRMFMYDPEFDKETGYFTNANVYNSKNTRFSVQMYEYIQTLSFQELFEYYIYASNSNKFNFMEMKLKEFMIQSEKTLSKHLNLFKVYKTDLFDFQNPCTVAKIIENHWNKYYLGNGKFAENNEYGAVEFIENTVALHSRDDMHNLMMILGLLSKDIIKFYKEYMYDKLNEIIWNNYSFNIGISNIIVSKILTEKEIEDHCYNDKFKNYSFFQYLKTNNEEILENLAKYSDPSITDLGKYLITGHNYLKEYLQNDGIYYTNVLQDVFYSKNHYVNNLRVNLNHNNAAKLLQMHSLFLKRNNPELYKIILDNIKVHSTEDLDVFIQQHGIENVFWSLIRPEYLSYKTKVALIKKYFDQLSNSVTFGYSAYSGAYIANLDEILIYKRVLNQFNINLIDYLSVVAKEIQKSNNKEILHAGWKLFGDFELPNKFFD